MMPWCPSFLEGKPAWMEVKGAGLRVGRPAPAHWASHLEHCRELESTRCGDDGEGG